MRGRVGRSDTSAFTYLLYAPETKLTDDAKRRLKALRELSGLGSGYELANRDLEIRGSGNIFGTDQSGDVDNVGYELYMNMLEKAIVTARGTTIRAVPECKVSSAAVACHLQCVHLLCAKVSCLHVQMCLCMRTTTIPELHATMLYGSA
jgi:transcription-repair coupling factor (superfamily II helicase)